MEGIQSISYLLDKYVIQKSCWLQYFILSLSTCGVVDVWYEVANRGVADYEVTEYEVAVFCFSIYLFLPIFS